MRGPAAKHPSVRQRRNKHVTNAVLKVVPGAKVPAVPAGTDWHPRAAEWWQDAWTSPMRQEWAKSDEHGIIRLLGLMHAYWMTFDAGDFKALPTLENAFNSGANRYGLNPMARRSLQWQIEQGEAAEEKTVQRRQARASKAKPTLVEADPRELLA